METVPFDATQVEALMHPTPSPEKRTENIKNPPEQPLQNVCPVVEPPKPVEDKQDKALQSERAPETPQPKDTLETSPKGSCKATPDSTVDVLANQVPYPTGAVYVRYS